MQFVFEATGPYPSGAGPRLGGTRSRASRRRLSDNDIRCSASDRGWFPARPAQHVHRRRNNGKGRIQNDKWRVETRNAGRAGAHRPSKALHGLGRRTPDGGSRGSASRHTCAETRRDLQRRTRRSALAIQGAATGHGLRTPDAAPRRSPSLPARAGRLVLNCGRAVSVCTVLAVSPLTSHLSPLTSRWYWNERLRSSNHRQTFGGSWWYYRLPFAWYLGKRPTTRREPVRGLA